MGFGSEKRTSYIFYQRLQEEVDGFIDKKKEHTTKMQRSEYLKESGAADDIGVPFPCLLSTFVSARPSPYIRIQSGKEQYCIFLFSVCFIGVRVCVCVFVCMCVCRL